MSTTKGRAFASASSAEPFSYDAEDVGRVDQVIDPLAPTFNNMTMSITKLVTERVAFGPATGTEGLTPGQLLDLQLIELAMQEGTPHELNIQIGEEMWRGVCHHYQKIGGTLQGAFELISVQQQKPTKAKTY